MTARTLDETASAGAREVGALFGDFLADTGSVDAAVLVGMDGLPLLWTAGMAAETVDQFAAMALGFHALASSSATVFACDRAERQLVELDGAYLAFDRVGAAAVLGVVVDHRGDIGAVAYDVTLLAERLEARLDPAVVAELADRVGP